MVQRRAHDPAEPERRRRAGGSPPRSRSSAPATSTSPSRRARCGGAPPGSIPAPARFPGARRQTPPGAGRAPGSRRWPSRAGSRCRTSRTAGGSSCSSSFSWLRVSSARCSDTGASGTTAVAGADRVPAGLPDWATAAEARWAHTGDGAAERQSTANIVRVMRGRNAAAAASPVVMPRYYAAAAGKVDRAGTRFCVRLSRPARGHDARTRSGQVFVLVLGRKIRVSRGGGGVRVVRAGRRRPRPGSPSRCAILRAAGLHADPARRHPRGGMALLRTQPGRREPRVRLRRQSPAARTQARMAARGRHRHRAARRVPWAARRRDRTRTARPGSLYFEQGGRRTNPQQLCTSVTRTSG